LRNVSQAVPHKNDSLLKKYCQNAIHLFLLTQMTW
jgi:hypothetical protein